MSFGDGRVMFNQGGETSDKRRREVDLYVYTDDVDEALRRSRIVSTSSKIPHDTFYGMRELIFRDLNRFWITFGQETR